MILTGLYLKIAKCRAYCMRLRTERNVQTGCWREMHADISKDDNKEHLQVYLQKNALERYRDAYASESAMPSVRKLVYFYNSSSYLFCGLSLHIYFILPPSHSVHEDIISRLKNTSGCHSCRCNRCGAVYSTYSSLSSRTGTFSGYKQRTQAVVR
jgi:hypothetical protein